MKHANVVVITLVGWIYVTSVYHDQMEKGCGHLSCDYFQGIMVTFVWTGFHWMAISKHPITVSGNCLFSLFFLFNFPCFYYSCYFIYTILNFIGNTKWELKNSWKICLMKEKNLMYIPLYMLMMNRYCVITDEYLLKFCIYKLCACFV